MTTRLHFYDAATPANVPSGAHAAVYVNGYAWKAGDARRMAAVFYVSVLPEASWARYARCLDIESGAAKPSDLPAFIHHRRTLGFNDATAYVNRSNWQAAYDAVKAAGEREPLWWVSTLDGTMDAELRVDGATIAIAWAVQYSGGPAARYDLSILHGVNNFHRP